MIRKILSAAGLTLLSLAIVVVVVYAFSFGNVDGVWGVIDPQVPEVPGEVVDVIGEIGNFTEPGGTDQTRVRLANVCGGDVDGDITFAEWETITYSYDGLGSYTNTCPTNTTSLFFSEYVFNQRNFNPDSGALEIYNGTGAAVNLSGYAVRLYTSATAYTVIPLNPVNLADNDVYVLVGANQAGDTTAEDQEYPDLEGYRTVVLVKNYEPGFNAPAGATCDRWATGPSTGNPLGTTGLTVQDDYWNQTLPNTDWNQVRYGGSGFSCLPWAEQSGLAFDGENAVTPDPPEFGEEQAFLLGKFCHVNNPISASNAFESVYNNMTISGIKCDDAAIGDAVPTEMTFSYHVFLDETTNSTPCAYPSTPGNPCADAVTASQPPAQTFRCNYPGDVYVDYTVAFLGFIPLANPDVTCTNEMFNEDLVQGAFISNEGTTNCGCVFGMITDSIPTAVDLLSFTAEGTQDSIELFWETGNEIDNLGFNLYRSDSLIGDRVLVNKQMIPSNVAPGSPFGAPYKFVDETVTDYRTYFYWLEDIDIYGKATLNGPVGASLK